MIPIHSQRDTNTTYESQMIVETQQVKTSKKAPQSLNLIMKKKRKP